MGRRSGRRAARPGVRALLAIGTALALGLAGCASVSSAATPSTSSTAVSAASSAGASAGSSAGSGARPGQAGATSTGAPRPTGHSGRYVTVGLGDSVPSAANCSGCVSYISQVGDRLAAGIGLPAVVDNDAVAGYLSSDVVSQLGSAGVRSQIADSDLVIITVGANDLGDALSGTCDRTSGCVRSTMAAVRARLTSIVEEVRALQTASDATVVVTGYWNVGQDGDVGQRNGTQYVATSRTLTRQFNALAADVAHSQKAVYADFYTPFVGADGSSDPTGLLASDGDHPDAAGHARLASAVLTALGV